MISFKSLSILSPILIALCFLQCQPIDTETPETIESRHANFILHKVADGLKVPWSMDWLPDGSALITDRRGGKVYLMKEVGSPLIELCNIPKVFVFQDSGIRDIAVHPEYGENGWIYLSYDISNQDSLSTLAVDRFKLEENCIQQRERLFEAKPWYRSGYHYGGRIVFKDGYLFFSVGDRHFRDSVQLLSTHNGKIMRLHEDGTVPDDNPFTHLPNTNPEIWSYGHRNPQGLCVHPVSGEIWEHEHGPKGGDEINIIHKGLNYGWPIITYGEEYAGGPIGAGITRKENMEQPFRFYAPSVAPSGMTFYTGKDFPEWEGNLFFAAMSQRNLYRLAFREGKLVGEERLLESKAWRIRFIRQGPDGLLYFGTDEGEIWQILPVKANS